MNIPDKEPDLIPLIEEARAMIKGNLIMYSPREYKAVIAALLDVMEKTIKLNV